METFKASFTIKAAYDVLSSPKNLSQSYGKDPTCSFSPTPATSLTQGRDTWLYTSRLVIK
ncbi:hypothetical protein N1851_012377 [Merluccius polli]|uniref:Uncharacterized protein n=1 Tax=Merluccius polli TaxID=89951 RepID=A0AA47P2B5_MERPO|nr:hypothetical protein N1851_012377 [Merluccius polli]